MTENDAYRGPHYPKLAGFNRRGMRAIGCECGEFLSDGDDARSAIQQYADHFVVTWRRDSHVVVFDASSVPVEMRDLALLAMWATYGAFATVAPPGSLPPFPGLVEELDAVLAKYQP